MSQTAVITGASRGIGKAVALKFASMGMNVAINYRSNEELANEVVKECESYGVLAKCYQGDVVDYPCMEAMMKEIQKDFGSIDILVNNSGITKDTLMMRMNTETFNDVIQVNLTGTFNATKAISKIFFKQKRGVIINMASVVGLIGNIGQANYAASKAGIIGLTKTLAKEFAGRNIRVNAIAPGFIESDMTNQLSEEVKNKMLENIPMKQFGKVEDVANLAYFLASDQSSYITGQVIQVDGGMVM